MNATFHATATTHTSPPPPTRGALLVVATNSSEKYYHEMRCLLGDLCRARVPTRVLLPPALPTAYWQDLDRWAPPGCAPYVSVRWLTGSHPLRSSADVERAWDQQRARAQQGSFLASAPPAATSHAARTYQARMDKVDGIRTCPFRETLYLDSDVRLWNASLALGWFDAMLLRMVKVAAAGHPGLLRLHLEA